MPSVLFIYKNKNLADQFVKHFKLNDYNIHQFYDEEIPYYQFSKIQKLENIFYRVIKKDTQHIHNINNRNFTNLSTRKLNQLKKQNLKFDFCFVIRGDLVPENVLQYARTISTKMIDYQLDGLSVSSKVLDYDQLFEQIYVFDEQDVRDYPDYNLKSITNCFFEEKCFSKTIDFSYIGVNTENRSEVLENLFDLIHKINPDFIIDFNLKQNDYNFIKSNKINMLQESMSYQECLDLSNQSKYLIDIKRAEHNGLSLRFFEALNFKNKIITNNQSVINYDFYHPDNIFITDFKNLEGLEAFISRPYYEIDEAIRSKYNFKNWINNIFKINK